MASCGFYIQPTDFQVLVKRPQNNDFITQGILFPGTVPVREQVLGNQREILT